MKSLILQTAARLLFPLLLVFALFITLRGHNAPGGGFIGGLIAAGAYALHLMAFGASDLLRALRVHPQSLLGVGLLVGVVAGMIPWLSGLPFMTGVWGYFSTGLAEPIKQGSPLLFDLGVFLVVLGFTLTILLSLQEED